MKNKRQQALMQIIKDNIVETQDQLQALLLSNGYNITQATVSRDIKYLGIVKALDSLGNYRYTASLAKNDHSDRYTEILKNSTLSIRAAMNDVIIKCYSGTASAACAAIDNLFSDMFVGTLAGDDTILVITESTQAANEFVDVLNKTIII